MLQHFKIFPQTANHETERRIILAQIGLTKVEKYCVDLSIVSHHAMSFRKDCHKLDHENKVA